MYGEGGNPFPHDGEHGADCTGYGSCDCDEKTMAIEVVAHQEVLQEIIQAV